MTPETSREKANERVLSEAKQKEIATRRELGPRLPPREKVTRVYAELPPPYWRSRGRTTSGGKHHPTRDST